MAYDAANPKHIRKAQREADAFEAQSAHFLRAAMATVEGRAYFLRWLERCHIFHNSFTANSNQTAFNCGEQNIGQQLIADIMLWCPDQYVLMMRERTDGRRTSDPSDDRSGRDQSNDRRSDNDSSSNGNTTADYDPVEVGLPGSIDDPNIRHYR